MVIYSAHWVSPNYVKKSLSTSTVVTDKYNRLLEMTLTEDEKFRYWQPLDKIPKAYIEAILSKEDRWFKFHPGVNPVALLRASLKHFFSGDTAGASTVTMQLARLYYKIQSKSYRGKLLQIIRAFQLELLLTKKEILEAYLNLVPMGGNKEGVAAGSLLYFDQWPSQLNQKQLHFLVDLPQNPNQFFQLAKRNNLKIKSKPIFQARHFSRHIRTTGGEKRRLRSSLDRELQQATKKILREYVRGVKKYNINNATALLVEISTGEIKSYVGSSDFFNDSIGGQVDGLQAKRSPGSTLKPFIYGLAMDQGLIIPQSIVYDSPLPYRTPENYDGTLKGPMTVEEALISSRNIPAVDINNQLTSPSLFEFLQHAGMAIDHEKSFYGSSIALGSLELSALEIAKLYLILANNGKVSELNFFPRAPSEQETYLMSPASAVIIKDILKKHPRPHFQQSDPYAARRGEVFWKTGTSFGFRDAWAVGIWGDYVLLTWLGDFKSVSNSHLIGYHMAGPLLFKLVDYLRQSGFYQAEADFMHLYSPQVSEVEVCTVSGKIPHPFCPHKKSSLFITHKSPVEKCPIHRKIRITENGLRSCQREGGTEQVYEFFSSQKRKLYRNFGLKLNPPPAFEPACQKMALTHIEGTKPVIISPKLGYTYMVEPARNRASIKIQAKADIDSDKLSWYLDGKLIKKAGAEDTFVIKLNSGEYLLKAVDQQGRMSERVFKVQNAFKKL